MWPPRSCFTLYSDFDSIEKHNRYHTLLLILSLEYIEIEKF